MWSIASWAFCSVAILPATLGEAGAPGQGRERAERGPELVRRDDGGGVRVARVHGVGVGDPCVAVGHAGVTAGLLQVPAAPL